MINPFAYREASNPLSGLAAGPKTLFLLCSAGASMTFGPPALALLLASGLVLHSLARIRPGETARALVFILGLAAAAALFRGLAPGDGRIFALESLGPSALYALRLVAVFLFARVFYVSTRVSRLGDSLTRVFRRAMPPSGSRGQSVFSATYSN